MSRVDPRASRSCPAGGGWLLCRLQLEDIHITCKVHLVGGGGRLNTVSRCMKNHIKPRARPKMSLGNWVSEQITGRCEDKLWSTFIEKEFVLLMGMSYRGTGHDICHQKGQGKVGDMLLRPRSRWVVLCQRGFAVALPSVCLSSAYLPSLYLGNI